MVQEEIALTLLDERSIEKQVLVYSAAFEPSISLEENLIKWKKKHYENPLGNSLIVGAFINEELVGMNAYMPVEYYVNGERVKMLQSCESGVLPSCQGKGIWKKVVTYALKYIKEETDYQVVIGFPNYYNSYPGFKKMGWKTVTNMKNYVLLNNLSAFKRVFENKNFLFRFALNGVSFQRTACSFYKREKYCIEKAQLEELVWNDTNTDVLTCAHSIELLKWKKDYKELKVLCIKEEKKTVATCLYGLSTYNGSTIIKLESFECLKEFDNKAKSILASLVGYFNQNHPEASFIRVWTQENSKMEVLLKKLLFVGSSHPNPFIVSDPESIYAKMLWSLSFFDLD